MLSILFHFPDSPILSHFFVLLTWPQGLSNYFISRASRYAFLFFSWMNLLKYSFSPPPFGHPHYLSKPSNTIISILSKTISLASKTSFTSSFVTRFSLDTLAFHRRFINLTNFASILIIRYSFFFKLLLGLFLYTANSITQ